MSSFTEPLIVEVTQREKRPFRVVRPFIYALGNLDSSHLVIVAPGFRTDFASVPFGFRWLVPVVGRHGKAAVLHDWLYSSKIMSRKAADDMFLEAMAVLGVRPWRRFLAYWGVRLFGGRSWRMARVVRRNLTG